MIGLIMFESPAEQQGARTSLNDCPGIVNMTTTLSQPAGIACKHGPISSEEIFH